MKWLFATLVALNLIVFAGMLGGKMLKRHTAAQQAVSTPVAPPQPQQQQPQIIINTGSSGSQQQANNNQGAYGGGQNKNYILPNQPRRPVVMLPREGKTQQPRAQKQAEGEVRQGSQHRPCSARVSLPEDDYHRIKGLLGRFPHAATRQVVEGGGEGNSQSSARMNVLFMSVSDEDAAALQGIVGRYGSLNMKTCK